MKLRELKKKCKLKKILDEKIANFLEFSRKMPQKVAKDTQSSLLKEQSSISSSKNTMKVHILKQKLTILQKIQSQKNTDLSAQMNLLKGINPDILLNMDKIELIDHQFDKEATKRKQFFDMYFSTLSGSLGKNMKKPEN